MLNTVFPLISSGLQNNRCPLISTATLDIHIEINLSKFKKHSITKTNELFYAGGIAVTNRLGVKIEKVAGRKEPMWKKRLQNKIK